MTVELAYKRHFTHLVNWVNQLCGSRHMAQDIVQESFIELHRAGIENFTDPDKVKFYLFETARSRYLNVVKHSKIKKSVHRAILENSDTVEEFKEVSARVNAGLLKRVYALIPYLPAQQQAVFKLVHFGRLSSEEVAERLKISRTAAPIQYNRAVERLSYLFTHKVEVKAKHKLPPRCEVLPLIPSIKSSKRQLIFHMIYVKGMTAQQVAGSLSLAESTVRVQYKRAFDFLIAMIKEKAAQKNEQPFQG